MKITKQNKGYYTTKGWVLVSAELVNNATGGAIDEIKEHAKTQPDNWYGYSTEFDIIVSYPTKKDLIGYIEWETTGE